MPLTADIDIAVIGGGAAGLATAIFAKGGTPTAQVAIFDGARKPGAKILVSGGSRCNVTNVVVTEADFNGGRPAIIRRVLRAFTPTATVDLFRRLGVSLHEEPGGKLFPDSNRSRDVLNALLGEVGRLGISLRAGDRVLDVVRVGDRFTLATSSGEVAARSVVLATGGLSLPKSGSDGGGYAVAQRLGHTLVPTTPALVPMVLESGDARAFHAELSGVAQPVRLVVRRDSRTLATIEGPLLWTHFGISGPAALDMSRHWLRARLYGGDPIVTANVVPDDRFETLEDRWIALARAQPRLRVHGALASMIPASVAAAIAIRLGIPEEQTLAALTRDRRRTLVHSLLEWPLRIVDSRGYNYAEVTAGGVALDEIEPGTMQSRVCPGLYLVGEILDVDGRLGGFNFQWAWASAYVAGRALAIRPRPCK